MDRDKKQEKTCSSCKWYQYSLIIDEYACVDGHSISNTDWRMKYECCDKWEARDAEM